ncbi:unnamed protein product [Oppiella nova]|uniref:Chitosanase n=1 Tax=Oppiella nova TaxID=334625 RepID=A0A7R9M4Q7_9ACAR|nr:unnamed protein product [Oppiella nova]CAG2170485.1 unnamed protein product [Oppiella nova]
MKYSLIFMVSVIVWKVSANLSKEAKKRCESYTSIFENDSIDLQYAYVEDIHDGRGYTSGRAGFTTGTGDAILVVKKYTEMKADNPLAKFITELERLAKKGSGDVSRLGGYPSAWKEAAKDPKFREVQDEVNDDLYYRPAMVRAKKAGVKSATGMCALYDCVIQHGDGDDGDSLGAIIKRTETSEGGPVKDDEKKWLKTFLKTRRYDLQHPYNRDTEEEWKNSVDRVDAMVKMIDEGNMEMKGPIHVKTPNHDLTIP